MRDVLDWLMLIIRNRRSRIALGYFWGLILHWRKTHDSPGHPVRIHQNDFRSEMTVLTTEH